MNTSVWINKQLWERVVELYERMKVNNSTLTMNKALNFIINEGVIGFDDETCTSFPHSTKKRLKENVNTEVSVNTGS